jgi:hypothetical protein
VASGQGPTTLTHGATNITNSGTSKAAPTTLNPGTTSTTPANSAEMESAATTTATGVLTESTATTTTTNTENTELLGATDNIAKSGSTAPVEIDAASLTAGDTASGNRPANRDEAAMPTNNTDDQGKDHEE